MFHKTFFLLASFLLQQKLHAEMVPDCTDECSCVELVPKYNCSNVCLRVFCPNSCSSACSHSKPGTHHCPKCARNAVLTFHKNTGNSSCECKPKFRGDPYRLCQPFCASKQLKINQIKYSFPDTWREHFSYSTETCPGTDRPRASVFCKKFAFEVFDAVVAPCNITLKSIIEDYSKNFTKNGLEALIKLRILLVTESNLIPEEVDSIQKILKNILSRNFEINPYVYKNAVAVLSELLENSTDSNGINLSLVKLMEEFSSHVVLSNQTDSTKIETEKVAAKIHIVNCESLENGKNLSDKVIIHKEETNYTEVAVKFHLPTSELLKRMKNSSSCNTQFFTIYYKTTELFPSELNVSWSFSISLGNNISTVNLENPLMINYANQHFKVGKVKLPSNPLLAERIELGCVFWNISTKKWSREGCFLDPHHFPPLCRCNHFTNFALLIARSVVPNDITLNYISDVGCILSIVGIGITVILHLIISERRQAQTTKIFLNVLFNLMVAYIIFVAGIDQTSKETVCFVITILLHYFFLSSWCWMTAYSFDLYLNLVKIFHDLTASKVFKGSCLFGYLLPAIIVGLTAGLNLGYFDKIDPGNAQDQENIMTTSSYLAENMCWVHGNSLYYGFLLPIGILVIINLYFYILLLVNLVCKKQKIGNVYSMISRQRMAAISLTLFSTMGIAWVVGFFMLVSTDPTYSLVLSWLFALATTSQGIMIFVSSCIIQTNIRIKILDWMKSTRSVLTQKSKTATTED